jgi:hypothetical protein
MIGEDAQASNLNWHQKEGQGRQATSLQAFGAERQATSARKIPRSCKQILGTGFETRINL